MGLYSFTAGGNTYYLLPSANVQVFPSAFREDYTADITAPSVIAAKLNTEYNLSHSTLNLNNSNYIISDNITDEPDSNGTIEMSLSGYYCRLVDFSAAGTEEPRAEGHLTGTEWNTICNLNTIYFHYYLDYITENSNIDKIIKKVLTPVTSGDTTYSIGIPGSSLDAITDESGDFTYFSGFCISNSIAPPTNSSNWISFQGLVSTTDKSRVIAAPGAKRVIPKEYGGIDLNIVNSTAGTYNLVGNVSSATSSSAAGGIRSAVFGTDTITSEQANSQFVIGKYNKISSPLPAGITSFNDVLFAIGNGTSISKRSNAMLVSTSGNVYANNYYDLNGNPIFNLNMKNGTGTGSLIGNDLNNNIASGSNSTVFGSNIKTNVNNAFIVGQYNDQLVDCYNADPYQDSIFAVGAGAPIKSFTPFRIDRSGKTYSSNFLCSQKFELKGDAGQPTALIFDTATNTFALGQNLTAISGSNAKISTDLIPNLSAAKITSGTLNSARLPAIPLNKLDTTNASNGYVIKYNGSTVVWAADEKGSGGGGTGIPSDFPIARGTGTRAIVGNTTYGQGLVATATAENACVFGEETRSTFKNQFAIGKYNDPRSSLLFMVGDGTSTSNRRNAFTVDTNGNANVRQTLTVGTKVSSPVFEGTSDIRLKENIKDFKYTKSILDLPIKKFDFINGEKNQIGCIAQDLKEFYPELVHKNEDGYLTIQETKLVYLLLEEVKLLKNKITELENK